MNISTAIFNKTGRLRSGWRAGIFFILWMVFSGTLGSIAYVLLGPGTPNAPSDIFRFAIYSAASLIPAILLGWLCGRWFEGLGFKALGASFSSGWFRHLILGLSIGGLSMAFAVVIAATFGDFSLILAPNLDVSRLLMSLAASFGVLAVAAAFEEAFFRGYPFQTLVRAGLAWPAMLLTAIFFGVVHLGNPSSGVISTVDTAIAGVLFSVAYLRSRDLWFPFGIHLMWNWMQGSVFGIEISGMTELYATSIFKEIDNGPVWLTGGDYGIEGGIASTAALILTGVFIYFAPIVKPDPELVELTSRENPKVSES